ncbi:MAG TPA: hypothetical protein VFH78_11360, partial [Candidatus Thermoplasmatota archaeon]|nr:hypothetical protein [Candidatus Thermoplasmatota archaeon]
MRDPIVRLLVLALLVLSLVASAAAQENTSGTETPDAAAGDGTDAPAEGGEGDGAGTPAEPAGLLELTME